MSFLNFWAIPIGAAALATPLLVHWLTKPRPTRIPYSTVRFVREVVKQRRAYNRLRDWLILLLRIAAIALLAAVIARPLTGDQAQLAAGDDKADTIRVVLLDVSQSMGAVSQGVQSLARARPIAARHVGYRSGTQTNLLLCAATPWPVFERPTTNFSMLVDEVSDCQPLPERLQVQPALNLAAEMFSKAGTEQSQRELIIISDFQRTNWAAADFTVLPFNTKIQLETVAPPETPHNLAILRVGCQQRIEAGRPFRLEVDVGNYSPAPRKVAVEVVLGTATFRLEGQCTAGNRSTLMTEVTLPTAGWLTGEARLVGVEDALAADNTRPVVLQVQPRPTYVLLTRQPATLRPSASYFLERALAPGGAEDTGERIVRVDPLHADPALLQSANLLLLDHPGRLSAEQIDLLASLMRRGRGILYVAAESADATNLKLLTDAAGSSLQLPVEFAPPASGQVRQNLFLTSIQDRATPFHVFGDEAMALLAPVRFGGGLATRRVAGALQDDVIATYNDQTTCLVISPCGAGTLAVLNADLGQSTLPASPAFVPLLAELSELLLGLERSPDAIFSGEPLAVYLPASASPVAGLQIEHPKLKTFDATSLGELHEENVGVMWQSTEAGPPGVYQIKRGPATLFAIATTIPPEEADLVPLASDLLTDRLAGGRNIKFRSSHDADESHDQLWSWLAIVCLACLALEVVGLRLFKS